MLSLSFLPQNHFKKVYDKQSGGGNGNTLQYFAWKIPWPEEPGRLQSMGSQSCTQRSTHAHTHTHLQNKSHTITIFNGNI